MSQQTFDSGAADAQRPVEGSDGGPRDAGVDASDASREGSAGSAGEPSAGAPGSAGAAAGSGAPEERCRRADRDAPVSLGEVREVGTVSSPASITLRIPGQIGWIGGKLTWLFPKSARKDGVVGADAAPNQPNAAFVSRDNPTTLEEDLDPDGVPRRFLTAYDENAMAELWPTALLHVPPPADQENATGLAIVRIAYDLFNYDVAVGRVSRDTTTAQEPLTPLFSGSDGRFSTGGFCGNEYGYLFACQQDSNVADPNDPLRHPCKVARAPVGELDRRDSYRVFDPAQQSWVADLSAGGPVIYGPYGTLSLSYNNYLGRYLVVHSRWFSNDVVVQSAPMPTGPWRQEFIFTLPTPSAGVVQSAMEQPALLGQDECAKTIWISYLSPTAEDMAFPTAGDIKLIRVELQ